VTSTGNLAISAQQQRTTTATGTTVKYTSARLNSLFQGKYGHIVARIQVPSGGGLLPAFWMLGSDASTVGWPKCGEIDVMESLGAHEPGVVYGTIHGPTGTGGKWSSGGSVHAASDLSTDFHEYSIDWWPGVIQLSVDGKPYAWRTPADLWPGQLWTYEKPFYMLVNVAVGGSWPGTPPSTTTFPQTMAVDYIRWSR
jgi:beta-glucanase (GH16 family)